MVLTVFSVAIQEQYGKPMNVIICYFAEAQFELHLLEDFNLGRSSLKLSMLFCCPLLLIF